MPEAAPPARTQAASGMPEEVAARKDLTDRLVAALGRNEFILFGQAIVPLAAPENERPFQEILIRFREEEDKLLPPGMFLPVLEKHGLMRLVDRWVVGRIANWIRSTRAQSPDAPLPRFSINLSADTLYDPKFAQHARQSVRSAELPEETLCFEVTLETARDHQASLASLGGELGAAGCRLSIARFDGSDTAFDLLDGLDPDFVKISPGLVREADRDGPNAAMLDKIARKCAPIGIRTIAEHVESPAVLARLRELGVDYAQGFGIEAPRPLAPLVHSGEAPGQAGVSAASRPDASPQAATASG